MGHGAEAGGLPRLEGRRCSATSSSPGRHERQGRGVRRLHAAARSWPNCSEAVYFGDGKKHLTWDYLKALTPLALAIWYMDDGSFTVRSKGVQERTAGGSGRIEICVEAMSRGLA